MPPGPVSSRVTGTFFDSCIFEFIWFVWETDIDLKWVCGMRNLAGDKGDIYRQLSCRRQRGKCRLGEQWLNFELHCAECGETWRTIHFEFPGQLNEWSLSDNAARSPVHPQIGRSTPPLALQTRLATQPSQWRKPRMLCDFPWMRNFKNNRWWRYADSSTGQTKEPKLPWKVDTQIRSQLTGHLLILAATGMSVRHVHVSSRCR